MTDETMIDDSIHALTGAYALDALPADERAAFVAHLDECDDCVAESTELIATAARLALLTEEPAPSHLRSAVLSAVARTPQDQPIAAATPAVVVDLAARRRRRWVASIGGALAAAAAVTTFLVVNNDEDPAGEILAAEDARTIVGEVAGGGEASLVVSDRLDGAVITFDDLPDPGEGRAYQMWLITGDAAPAPEETFDPSEGTATVLLEGAPDADFVALTVEPEGGSDAPTTDPIAVISLDG